MGFTCRDGNQRRGNDVGSGMRNLFRLIALPVALLLVAAACGSDQQDVRADPPTSTTSPGGTTDRPPTDPPPSVYNVSRQADDVVFRVNDCCGYVPAEIALGSVPSLSILGDGTVITVGPTTQQYPPHALPNLLTNATSPMSIDRLITEAQDAGLLDADVDFGQPGITDMASTTVTLTFDGKQHTISAYALSADTPSEAESGLTAKQIANRKALVALLQAANNAGGDAFGTFEPKAVSVYVLPVPENGGVEGGVDPGQAVWPLDDPTAWPKQTESSYVCNTYSGDDAVKALAAAKGASTATNWSLGSTTPTTGPAGNTTSPPPFRLVFRPLLPDEKTACPA